MIKNKKSKASNALIKSRIQENQNGTTMNGEAEAMNFLSTFSGFYVFHSTVFYMF